MNEVQRNWAAKDKWKFSGKLDFRGWRCSSAGQQVFSKQETTAQNPLAQKSQISDLVLHDNLVMEGSTLPSTITWLLGYKLRSRLG
jgi:hypothetical protein